MDSENPISGGGPEPSPDPKLVLVLNLLLFGFAGYWIIGQRHKAVIAAIGWTLGLFTCGVVSGLVAAVAAIDGYQQANRMRANPSNGS